MKLNFKTRISSLSFGSNSSSAISGLVQNYVTTHPNSLLIGKTGPTGASGSGGGGGGNLVKPTSNFVYNASVNDSVILYDFQSDLEEEKEKLGNIVSYTVNLYAPSSALTVGSTITIKNKISSGFGNNQIVIVTPSGTIDNISNKTYICSDRGNITLVTDKINWYTMSSPNILGKLLFKQNSYPQTIQNSTQTIIYYNNISNTIGTFSTNSGFFTITSTETGGTIIKNISNITLRLRVNAVTTTWEGSKFTADNVEQIIGVFSTTIGDMISYGFTKVSVNNNIVSIQSNSEFDLPTNRSMAIVFKQDSGNTVNTSWASESFGYTQLSVTHVGI